MSWSERGESVAKALIANIEKAAPEEIEPDHFGHQEDAYWAGVEHAIDEIKEFFDL